MSWNWFKLLQVVSVLKDDIEKAVEDKEITVNELLDMIKDGVNAAGLGDVVIVNKEMVEKIDNKF